MPASLHASQADAALASLGESGFGPSVVSYSQLDLADFDSISLFVDRLKKEEHSKIALLVCNAAKMDLPFSLDSNGVELHISTNFLGHAKLIFDLLPTLARKARIVNLGSSAHHAARHLDLAPTPANYSRLGSYAVSKSCVAMYSIHTLAPVLRRNGIKVLVVHPGVIPTDLYASNPFGIGALFRLLRSHPILSAPLRLLMLSEREGAWTILDACLGDHETGEYLAYGQSCRPSKLVLSKSECRRLEKWTGKMLER